MRALPIGPEEAFVLSRVDGRTSEQDIAALTGLDPAHVTGMLTRLEELGAVSFDADPQPAERPAPERSSAPPGGRLTRPVIESREVLPDASHPAAALYDPAELDEEVDLDLQRKRLILDNYYRLDSVSHYELLGIAPTAEKKAIKEAYFQAVATFHPDRYYGKSLGNFKAKLERVFQRLTEAHDVLTRKKSRDDYDQYLSTQLRNRSLEQLLGDERARADELERAKRRIEEEARIAERAAHTPSQQMRAVDPEERRRALARRLRGSMQPPARSDAPPPPSSGAIKEMVADELRRRYDQRLSQARDTQIESYRKAAEEALQTNNVVSAANALRIAASLAPDDKELAEKLELVQAKANTELADSYLDQARYEERNGRMLEAALSYERAARGKPNALVFERAAHCLVEGDGDMRKAADLAKKAVGLAPKSHEPKVTLARIYAKAGMKESALLEFERASQLAPDDDSIKDWIKRLKRGEA